MQFSDTVGKRHTRTEEFPAQSYLLESVQLLPVTMFPCWDIDAHSSNTDG